MDIHPDFPPLPQPSAISKPLPQPGITLLRRLPDNLAGPVRVRRRKHLFPEWVSATAQLKGSALVITAKSTVIIAMDVHQVTHHPSTSPPFTVTVTVRSLMPGVYAKMRLYEKAQEWLSALLSISSSRSPKLSDFEVITPLGKGGGGEVYLVKEKNYIPYADPRIPLAMKVVQKHDAFYSDGSLRHALDERLVLQLTRGFPFVIRMTHAFQTEKALYMVSELCSGGDLRTMLRRQKTGRLTEEKARPIMAQIVLALEHIHSLNVIYRDIKPDNILFSAEGDVRICDFGLSKVLSTGRFGRTRSFCGSTAYMSPQIVTGKGYGIATDLWSLGALFYRIIVGRSPFEENPYKLGFRNETHDIQKRIQIGDVGFPTVISDDAREMLEGLLRKKEEDRFNLQDLKESLFFKDINWNYMLEQAYDHASNANPVLMGNLAENFDSKRLISQGVKLEDIELNQRRRADKARKGFLSRQTSRLADSLQRRADMKNHSRSTSILGFGFSFSSDLGSYRSDTDSSS